MSTPKTRTEPRREPPGLEHGGFAVFRSPLLPFTVLTDWARGLKAPACTDDARLASALEADGIVLRERLRALAIQPQFREAIFIASPDLEESLPFWEQDPCSVRGIKVERSLLRYFGRMAARSTPFGLFAGYSVAEVGAQTRLTLVAREAYERHTRLDMDFVCELVNVLAAEPALRRELTYFPNSSLYGAGGRLRYVQFAIHDQRRTYTLVGAERSDYLEATLERARKGATFKALSSALGLEQEVSSEDAAEFVEQLIATQMLVSDLAPSITGDQPMTELLRILVKHPDQASCCRLLEAAQKDLEEIDRSRTAAPQRYRALAARLEPLPASPDLRRLFQVDLAKPGAELVVGQIAIDALLEGIGLLARISVTPPPDALNEFKTAFLNRYQERELPLLEVLDEEIGIGFGTNDNPASCGTPVLRGLPFPAEKGGPHSPSFGARSRLLLAKLTAAQKDGKTEIELTDADLGPLEVSPLPLPDSLFVSATLVASSAVEVDAGRFRVVLREAVGPSGATLFGRFCQADAGLTAKVRRILCDEEACRPDAVFAEIAHFPEGRVGNVLTRPILRKHEISYLGKGGAPADRQISAADLLVSTRGERIVLRSRSLGKEILPRLTNAHESLDPRNVSVYRFLCALQLQGVRSHLVFSWGGLENSPFLPRVVSGRCVLAVARWNLDSRMLGRLQRPTAAERFRAVQALRREAKLPRFVAEVEDDHFVPVDLDNPLVIEAFVQRHAKDSSLRLEEIYPGPEALCLTGPEGPFTHELMVPFTRLRPEKTVAAPPMREGPGPGAARTFVPGGEWLYAKLYCGNATADGVLREVVAPLIHAARTVGGLHSWFFLRYGDPDFHLRVRVQGDPGKLWPQLIPQLHARAAPLLADGRLWKLQLDTYEREVERYGGPEGVVLAEKFFTADSDAMVRMLPLFEESLGVDLRWRLALRGVDQLLTDLGFGLKEKHALTKRWRELFYAEFRVDKALQTELSDRYRHERARIEALLGSNGGGDDPLSLGVAELLRRSRELEGWAAQLKAAALQAPLDELAFSYVHMQTNRLVHASPRAHELVIYEFLERTYQSMIARAYPPRSDGRRSS